MAKRLAEYERKRDPKKTPEPFSGKERKAKGMDLPEPKEEEEAEVVDLMAALRESVQRTKRQSRATTSTAKRQSPRRGTAKTKKPARKAG